MPKVIVDGIEVEVPEGSTVLQACEAEVKKFHAFVTMIVSQLLEIAECVWLRFHQGLLNLRPAVPFPQWIIRK